MSATETIGVDDPRRGQVIAQYFAEQKLKKRAVDVTGLGFDDGPVKKKDRLNSVAQKTVVDGIVFASKHEAQRYAELKLLERAGLISHLRLQVLFPLVVNDVAIFPKGYRADSVYLGKQPDGVTWKLVVEDCKPSSGFRTDTYLCKKQLMLAIWNIRIFETYPPR